MFTTGRNCLPASCYRVPLTSGVQSVLVPEVSSTCLCTWDGRSALLGQRMDLSAPPPPPPPQGKDGVVPAMWAPARLRSGKCLIVDSLPSQDPSCIWSLIAGNKVIFSPGPAGTNPTSKQPMYLPEVELQPLVPSRGMGDGAEGSMLPIVAWSFW